jgi:hypothetical protein
MKSTIYATYSAAIVMAVAVCVAFFAMGLNVAQATYSQSGYSMDDTQVDTEAETTSADESDKDTEAADEDTEEEDKKREEMMKLVDFVQGVVKQQIGIRQQMDIHKDAVKEVMEETKTELKEKRVESRVDKVEFMSSLENLGEEEKRAAMKEFILQLRQEIEERKAAMQAQREELKEERKELQDEFVENVQGMSRAERVAAIMEKVAALKERLKEKMNEDADEEQSETEEEVDYVGMTTSEAQAAAKENGVPFRIGMLDGDLQLVTLDYRPGRITAEVENDIVVNYSVE